MHNSLPPLIRGIGTTIILAAMVIAFCIAGRDDRTLSTSIHSLPGGSPLGNVAMPVPASGATEARQNSDDLVEELLDNDWLQWMSFAGTALIAGSFFAEAHVRRTAMTE